MSEHLLKPLKQLNAVYERLKKAQEHSPELIEDEILHQLTQVIDLLREHSDAAYLQGQDWLVRVFTHHTQLSPAIERDLLWFFGGDCLHYLTDEEIAAFQQQEEDAEF